MLSKGPVMLSECPTMLSEVSTILSEVSTKCPTMLSEVSTILSKSKDHIILSEGPTMLSASHFLRASEGPAMLSEGPTVLSEGPQWQKVARRRGHLGGNDWGRRKFWKFGGNLLESLSGALNHLYFSKFPGAAPPSPARALPMNPAEAAPQTPAGAPSAGV